MNRFFRLLTPRFQLRAGLALVVFLLTAGCSELKPAGPPENAGSAPAGSDSPTSQENRASDSDTAGKEKP